MPDAATQAATPTTTAAAPNYAADGIFYPTARKALWTGGMNLLADPLWVMLLDGTYVPDPAHQFKSSLTGEIVAPWYTPGGQQLMAKSVAIDTSYRVVFRAAPASWTSDTPRPGAYAIYKKAAADSASPLVMYVPMAPSSGLTLSFDPTLGVLNW